MAKLILGIFIGGGLVLTILSLVEVEERKKRKEIEKWESKLP